MSDWRIAFTSAVLCGKKLGLMLVVRTAVSLCKKKGLPCGSGGPIIDKISGSCVSSVANVLVNCSNSDFLGSTLVGDRQVSKSRDLGSVEKLKDCFFLFALLGALLDVRKSVLRLSLGVSFSLGELPWFCGSELGASGSVISLPELSFRHSGPRSKKFIGI